MYAMSGSEKRLWPLAVESCCGRRGCGERDVTMEVEEEQGEEGHEEKSDKSESRASMYMDWVLSFRRPDSSLLLTGCGGSPRLPGGLADIREWEWMPCGSFTVPGMMGLRRCSGCREEVQGEGLAPGALACSSDGFGGQAGLDPLCWWQPGPAVLQSRRHPPPSPSLVQTFWLGT